MASLNADDLGRVLLVEYDYKYKANDGRIITIADGEEFILLKKSNTDWWQVIKEGEKKPFYIPAAYVKELDARRFSEHPYLKKAQATLLKNKQKQANSVEKVKPETEPQRKSFQPKIKGKERLIVLAGSREDLTVLSSTNNDKFCEMRASCDSLDKFIENENPYDEVPFETTFSKTVHQESSSKDTTLYEEPEYENLEFIKPVSPTNQKQRSSLPNTVANENENISISPKNQAHHDKSKAPTIAQHPTKPGYANLKSETIIRPGLPFVHSGDSTTVEVLHDGWKLQLDDQSGSKYYLNPQTGEMRVKPPRSNAHDSIRTHVNPTSGNKIVAPAVPDASKKPSLDHRRSSPQQSEYMHSFQRHSMSPSNQSPHHELFSTEKTDQFLNSTKIDSEKDDKDTPKGNDNNSNSSHVSFVPNVTSVNEEKKHQKTYSGSSQKTIETMPLSNPKSRHKSRSSSFTMNRTKYKSPIGWMKEKDPNDEVVFVNESSGDRWHQMVDEKTGNYYYFNELTRQTSWQLPQNVIGRNDELCEESHSSEESGNSINNSNLAKSLSEKDFRSRKANTLERDTVLCTKTTEEFSHQSSSLPFNTSPPMLPAVKPRSGRTFARQVDRVMQARSMILLSDVQTNAREEVHQTVEYQGRIHWTKLIEAGKKQRKNWIQQWVVLLGNNLLFYKDQKQVALTKTLAHGRPESSCDLHGAIVNWSKDKSSKKNVIELQTIRGLTLLLQHDDLQSIMKWLSSIKEAIQKANIADPLDPNIFNQKAIRDDEDEETDSKKKKDKKKKHKPPMRHASDAKNPDKVRSKLKKFINRRPTFESLQERGIIKETVFGCPLDKLCEKERDTVPHFIKLCVEEVEKRGLEIDGIYRVSGNLSHVQKLRYMIDRDEPVNLSEPEWEDIHLITGALKMFLRELPEPVIPFTFFDKFIAACKIQDENQRITAMKGLVEVLPNANASTLRYLMRHFCRVVEHSTKNRMQVQNIAIVFGPTLLLKPPEESRNDPSGGGHMAVYMVYQNQIIDCMLTEYDIIFGK